MRYLLTIIALALSILSTSAQILKVRSFALDETDLTAKIHEVLDFDDEPCACIKVHISDTTATFVGDIPYTPVYNQKEKCFWVYICNESKHMKVISRDAAEPLEIVFADYGVKTVKKNLTYKLVITSPKSIDDAHAKYRYTASESMSMQEAKKIAVEKTRELAITRAIGNGKKGKWVVDTKDPVVKTSLNDDGGIVIECEVWGEVIEIAQNTVKLDWRILVGSPDGDEGDTFFSGDAMYIYFKSPVSGYVAAYLLDGSDYAYCLVPYIGADNDRMKVNSGRAYTLLQRSTEQNGKISTIMTTDKESESNEVVLIFSTNPFTKCMGKIMSNIYCSNIKHYNSWLENLQEKDPELIVEKRTVQILKK